MRITRKPPHQARTYTLAAQPYSPSTKPVRSDERVIISVVGPTSTYRLEMTLSEARQMVEDLRALL
jgi:hypothetical protein